MTDDAPQMSERKVAGADTGYLANLRRGFLKEAVQLVRVGDSDTAGDKLAKAEAVHRLGSRLAGMGLLPGVEREHALMLTTEESHILDWARQQEEIREAQEARGPDQT